MNKGSLIDRPAEEQVLQATIEYDDNNKSNKKQVGRFPAWSQNWLFPCNIYRITSNEIPLLFSSFHPVLISLQLSHQMFAQMTKLFSKLDFMLLIISAVFLFPVSQISTLVSIRHYFAIQLHLFCFFYFRFSVCFPGSFISNLSCHLGKVFQSFNHL